MTLSRAAPRPTRAPNLPCMMVGGAPTKTPTARPSGSPKTPHIQGPLPAGHRLVFFHSLEIRAQTPKVNVPPPLLFTPRSPPSPNLP